MDKKTSSCAQSALLDLYLPMETSENNASAHYHYSVLTPTSAHENLTLFLNGHCEPDQ